MTTRQQNRISQAKILIARELDFKTSELIVEDMGGGHGWRVFSPDKRAKIIVWSRGNSTWDKHPYRIPFCLPSIPY